MIAFNTGRYYSEYGQRIIAEKTFEGVLFRDIDRRMIEFIPGCNLDPKNIMRHYDTGNYRWCGMDLLPLRDKLEHIDPDSITFHSVPL